MAAQRLAAIMFTDIVGYTTVMQHDRKKAIAAVHTHEDVLRRLVPNQDGELVQTYGDGSLSIFNSAQLRRNVPAGNIYRRQIFWKKLRSSTKKPSNLPRSTIPLKQSSGWDIYII